MRTSNFMTACWKDRIKQIPFYLMIIVSVFASCKKSDTNTIGADFIATRNGFNVYFTDTTSLILFSSVHDSVPTRNLTYFMLGDMNDPIFGKSKASIFTQFSVPVNQFSLQDGIIDSVVLRLKYVSTNSYYGNIWSAQDISVYELKEQLLAVADSGYYSNRTYNFMSSGQTMTSPIGYYSGSFNLIDSFYETINGINYTLEPHLRIKLNNSFVSKLQRAESVGAFITNTAFQNYINGLAVIAQTPDYKNQAGQGAITNFSMRSSVSGVAIYYHNAAGQQIQVFPIFTTDVVTNQYGHNFPTAILQKLKPYNNLVHSDECYLEATAGIKTRILTPNILSLVRNHDVAIIGAELVLTVQDGKDDQTYKVPNNLYLLGADSLGRNALLEDIFEIYPENYYGGVYDPSTRTYKFNIVRHIQNIISTYRKTGKDINYGMNLLIPADDYKNGIGTGRLVLNTNTINKKVKLNLSYTVIK